MRSNIYHLLYISRASGSAAATNLEQIGVQSLQKNTQLEVTGILLARDDNYVQLLEGPTKSVIRLFERIMRDDRHVEVHTLFRGYADRRLYGSSPMAVVNLDAESAHNVTELRRIVDQLISERHCSRQTLKIRMTLRHFSDQLIHAV